MADLARLLGPAPGIDDPDADDRMAPGTGDPAAPVVALRRLIAGVDALGERGDRRAAKTLAGARAAAANTITFDVALFEQNIKNALVGQTLGHAFSIASLGQLYQGGESSGLARTAADAPQTGQSPAKEMHVASVSKTLTAIVLLRLLEDLGLTQEAFVAPYLPSDWVLSASASSLRFRHFLTHTSGFGQVNAGSDYASLQTAMGAVAGPLPFSYRNANFGLLRLLVAGLMGIDPVDDPQFSADGLTAAAFLISAYQLYGGIGVAIDCAPSDATPTIQYPFPDDGLPGYLEPDRRLLCGGYGWFISSNELASVLANLHQTGNLLSPQGWALMRENFYGFDDPANFSFVAGDFGVYSMHGGDWLHGGREAHACGAIFPIHVEAGLVINSATGPGMPYQCAVLRTAFDDAWVAT